MKTKTTESAAGPGLARRSFLRYAGAGAASVGLLAASACNKDQYNPNTFDVGSGDIGILNYAYALEQLEAAFYTQVIATPYSGISNSEMTMLTAIRDHEILHRNFFKAAIPLANAIPALTPDFSSVNFSDRTSVLAQAKAFEDTGVMAYDGAGYLITSPDYFAIAGKIVSVEARHAAYIRDLIAPGSFVDAAIINANGLNPTLTIPQVLSIANNYLKTKVSAKSFGYFI